MQLPRHRDLRGLPRGLTALLALLALAAGACGDDGAADAGPTDDGGGADAARDAGGGGGDTVTAVGQLSVELDPGDPASPSCTFTVSLDAEEDRTTPWRCPDCDVMVRGPFTVTDGADCLRSLLGHDAAETMTVGWSDGGTFHASFSDSRPLSFRGTARRAGSTLELTYSSAGLTGAATGTGSLTLGTSSGDPTRGVVVPDTYACGWSKADPAPYTGDYVAADGAPLPDAILRDACGEPVRLHDLLGAWLVVIGQAREASCPDCADLASGQEAAVADLASRGVDATVVTLLTDDFFEGHITPSQAELSAYVDRNGVTGPVLADQGYAWSVMCALDGRGGRCEWPFVFVVDPDGRLVAHGATTWPAIVSSIP